MREKSKNKLHLISPISTSGAGVDFERRIQAFFVIQMINHGFVPTLPTCEITKVLFQGRNSGYNTDDCVVFAIDADKVEHKLLVQCKLSVGISKSNEEFTKTIKAAWIDFAENSLFDRSNDKIALITGNLSELDNNILEIFRDIHVETSQDIFWKKYDGIAFSKKAKEKLEVVIGSIVKANNNIRPDNKELFDFFKIFHILKSDLHEDRLERGGINLSLLQTELNSYEQSPQDIWNGIETYLREYNRLTIPIEQSNLPDELKDLFVQAERAQQPQDLLLQQGLSEEMTEREVICSSSHKKELILLVILGGFDQKNHADEKVVKELLEVNLGVLQSDLQDLLAEKNLSLIDGIWKIKADRKKVIELLGEKIFDPDIENFKTIFLRVLGEINPAFDLPENQRPMAGFLNKNLQYSKDLRKGVANGMALIANNENSFSNCSYMKVENSTASAVHELFANYEAPNLWASLNEVLTPIAEIYPREFLNVVKKAFNLKNNPFIKFTKDYNPGIFFSTDYTSGLRWALTDLAWNKDYLGEAALLLAKLAGLEKDNDPYHHHYSLTSLIEILLPWHPQTMAEPKNRIAIVTNILTENPDIGWELLKSLLPNKTTSSGNHPSPLWHDIVPEEEQRVTNKEYWEQSEQYAKLFVANAKKLPQILDVIHNINSLPKSAFDEFVKNLNSIVLKNQLSEDDKEKIWNALLSEEHRNNRQISADPKYFLPMAYVNKIEELIGKFAPENLLKKYKRLFNNNEFDLYEDSNNLDVSRKKLEIQRVNAIKNIINTLGIDAVITLVDEVKFPQLVGFSLGRLEGLDSEVLPKYLNQINSHKLFIKGYIDGRFYRTNPFDMNENMKWIRSIDLSRWTNEKAALFLVDLPFKKDVWDILDRQSKEVQKIYWQEKTDFRDMSDQEYSDYPFVKLLGAKRPLAAVDCFQWILFRYKKVQKSSLGDISEINVDTCRQILLDLLKSKQIEESEIPDSQMFYYNLMEMIDFLQQKLPLTDSDLWVIEWNFMPLFNSYNKEIPKAVIYSIENDPEMFHQLVESAFRSENTQNTNKMPETSRQVTSNIFDVTLLHKFKILPGTNESGKFVAQKFNSWIAKAKALCEASGHWKIAQEIIGGYLINSPKDQTGLFIHKSVARALDQTDNEKMRQGYRLGIMNSLGVQTVDPRGSANHNRSKVWSQRVDEIEKAGFINLAATLRDLSKSFETDSRRDVIEAKKFDEGIE